VPSVQPCGVIAYAAWLDEDPADTDRVGSVSEGVKGPRFYKGVSDVYDAWKDSDGCPKCGCMELVETECDHPLKKDLRWQVSVC